MPQSGLRCDLHVHTCLSHDGSGTVEDHCRAALARGIRVIGFTEHVDFDPADPGFGYYDYEACVSAIMDARRRFGRDLEILMAVEIDYQDWFEEDIARFLRRHAFDYVIGSVHAVGAQRLMGAEYCAGRTAHQAYADYFAAVRKSAASGLFDVIGHPGYATRRGIGVYGEPDYAALRDEIREALQTIVDSGTCLEINGAGLRHAQAEPYPGRAILAAFRDLGGRKVTLGSDSHQPEHTGVGIPEPLLASVAQEDWELITFGAAT